MLTLLVYLTQNILITLYFSFFLFLSSWLGIAFAYNFIETILFLESLYLAMIIFCASLSVIVNHFLMDLFLIFLIFFTVCDSIVALIFVLITFQTLKTINIKHFSSIKN